MPGRQTEGPLVPYAGRVRPTAVAVRCGRRGPQSGPQTPGQRWNLTENSTSHWRISPPVTDGELHYGAGARLYAGGMPSYLPRVVDPLIRDALASSGAVVLRGARATGKAESAL